jgi:hypothetical protein
MLMERADSSAATSSLLEVCSGRSQPPRDSGRVVRAWPILHEHILAAVLVLAQPARASLLIEAPLLEFRETVLARKQRICTIVLAAAP